MIYGIKHSLCVVKSLFYWIAIIHTPLFTESNLRASISNSNISETSIHFEWRHPTHSDLIQHYSVTISHNNGTTITSSLVSKQTSFTFQYEFIPGNRYYLRVTSHVRINNPSETFTIYREQSLVLGMIIYFKVCIPYTEVSDSDSRIILNTTNTWVFDTYTPSSLIPWSYW